MRLDPEYFTPFDEIYDAVTDRIRERASKLPVPVETAWLNQIVVDFKSERNRWPDSAQLVLYRRQWKRLRFRVVRLVAAVYLHVSYDLPRVLADNWPAKGIWSGGPSEPQVERLYFDLRSIFSDIFSTRARRLQVTGIFAPMLWIVPLALISNLRHWVSHLREATWRHGRTLSDLSPADRDYAERRMIEAMTLALGEVSNLPWRFILPDPPNLVMPVFAVVPAVVVVPDAVIASLLVVAFILLCAAGYISWALRGADEISRFVDEFGLRVERYMDLAVNHPETFEAMIRATGRDFQARI